MYDKYLRERKINENLDCSEVAEELYTLARLSMGEHPARGILNLISSKNGRKSQVYVPHYINNATVIEDFQYHTVFVDGTIGTVFDITMNRLISIQEFISGITASTLGIALDANNILAQSIRNCRCQLTYDGITYLNIVSYNDREYENCFNNTVDFARNFLMDEYKYGR